ncbi:MAG: PDZ domain-containing protein [Opitutae bacterium]|nr:PDZ domain-containing protein [Opitutae bacterium]NBY42505.1 PDZ domain-containing protein [Verrucomicrobiota bacterium]
MSRLFAALLLLPSLLFAGVTFETDSRELNRSRPGASYADMLAQVTPAVVSIRIAKTIPNEVIRRWRGRLTAEDLKQLKVDAQTGEVLLFQGLGSGTIVNSNGYIITNRHVVLVSDDRTGAVTIANAAYVTLSDKREFKAQVLAVDEKTDIAVLKINEKNLPFARFANSDKCRVGDVVFAIGNPLGVGMTVTSGIVSGLSRSDTGVGLAYQDFIQTDAAINAGNSGGPLIDHEGRIIGMNTMIRTAGQGGNIGIGFSIPSNLISGVALDLANTGKVTRGFLGLFGEDLEMDAAKKLMLNNGAVRITEVAEASPAFRSGLRKDDIITAVDGKSFESWNELRIIIARRKPGEVMQLSMIRNGANSLVNITVSERAPGN